MNVLDQLLQYANQIKNQTGKYLNTHQLVGSLFASIIEYLKNIISGQIRQPAVDTYAQLLSKYPNPEKGWTVLVRNEKTIYQWNGSQWVNLESGVYDDDVALNGGSTKTVQDIDIQKAGINTEIILKPKAITRQIATHELCVWKNKCYNVTSGLPVLQNEPIGVGGICYSNFIHIAELSSVEALSNESENIPAILYFAEKDLSTYLGCEYGTEQVYFTWYKYSGTPNFKGAKYVIVQLNTNFAIPGTYEFGTILKKIASSSIDPDTLWIADTSSLCNKTGGYYNIYNSNSIPVFYETESTTDRYSDFININDVGSVEATSKNNLDENGNYIFPAILYFKDKDLSSYLGCEYGRSLIISSWAKYSNTPYYPDANYIIIQQNYELSAAYKSESAMPYYEANRKTQTARITTFKHYLELSNNQPILIPNSIDICCSGYININEIVYIEALSALNRNIPAILYFSEKENLHSYLGCEYGTEQVYPGWEKFSGKPTIPHGANYAIIQYNSHPSLETSTYYSVLIQKDSQNTIIRTLYNKEKNIYNVRDYGAKGDGITDDVDAIQSAIDDCFKGGGGIVYIPIGVYRLNKVYTRTNPDGSPSTNHLFIPLSDKTYNVTPIKIVGEGSLNIAGLYVYFYDDRLLGTVQPNGTTLFSDYLPDNHVQTSPISVIGSCYAESSAWIRLNCTRTILEDINVVTKCCPNGYPVLSGIDFGFIGNCIIRNVSVRTDLVATSLQSPTKYGHVSAGIMMSKQYCDPHTTIYDTSISGGFAYGLLSGEHCQGHAIDIQTCDNAFVFAKSDHPNYFSNVSAHNCKNQIAALPAKFGTFDVGESSFKFEFMDFEGNFNQEPIDFNYQYAIKDPDNLLFGKLDYFMVQSGVPNSGASNERFSVLGAEHVKIDTMNK